MANDPIQVLSQRVGALELAVFALCKTAAHKDELIADINRLMAGLQPEDPNMNPHFDEIKGLLYQYRQYAEIGNLIGSKE